MAGAVPTAMPSAQVGPQNLRANILKSAAGNFHAKNLSWSMQTALPSAQVAGKF
jgi:hypothetical protein